MWVAFKGFLPQLLMELVPSLKRHLRPHNLQVSDPPFTQWVSGWPVTIRFFEKKSKYL